MTCSGAQGKQAEPEIHLEDDDEFREKAHTTVPGNIKMFSGCKDDQTSADVSNVAKFGLPDSDGAGGACTNALLKALQDSEDPTWIDVLKSARETLKTDRFTQVPQLSTSHSLNLREKFNVKPGPNHTKALFIGINYGQLTNS